MNYVGIDPGKGGAVVVLSKDSRVLISQRMPLIGRGKYSSLNFKDLAAWIRLGHDESRVYYEQFRPLGLNGKLTWYSCGEAKGQIEGLCAGLRVPVEGVPPKVWQSMIPNRPSGDRAALKPFIVAWAKKQWPEIPINCKADWDMADAACIAEWGRRNSGS